MDKYIYCKTEKIHALTYNALIALGLKPFSSQTKDFRAFPTLGVDCARMLIQGAGADKASFKPETTLSEVVEELNNIVRPIEVRLNGEYTAIITKDDISVGCQTFPHSIIEKLQEAIDTINTINKS